MARLDALPWTAGVSLESYGVSIGVRVEDARILRHLPLHLPPVRKPLASGEVAHLFSLRGDSGRLYEGPRLVRRAAALDLTMKLDLLRSLIEHQVATNAPAHTFVHAGVVEWQGRAIVIPGRSRSGKTTLVRALLRAGARYYSDEFAVVDTAGRVRPWSRRLRIRRPGQLPRSYPVDRFGERAPQRSLRIGLIVATEHRLGAHWRPRALSPGQALLALVRHTHVTRRRPDETIRVLGRAVRGATGLASRRGEAEDLAAELLAAR